MDEGSATRTRLLDAAARLFYVQGVHVGVAALCEEAGVSKRSMYQYFDSKEEVLAASLARSVPDYLASLLPSPDLPLAPRERIMAVFERIEVMVTEPDFHGCPYMSVATEVKEVEHPALAVSRAFHDELTGWFRRAAQDAGAADPDLLALELTATHDGTIARSVVRRAPLHGLAVRMAGVLLDSAGVWQQRD